MKTNTKTKTKTKSITKDSKRGILDKGKHVSTAFFTYALIALILTIVVPLGSAANPFVIYSRNISTIAICILLGFYFRVWGGRSKYLNSKKMKQFKFFTLIAGLACLAKAVLTVSYFFLMNMDITLASLYYLGDAVLWAGVAVFFISYFIILIPCQIIKGDPKSTNEAGRFL